MEIKKETIESYLNKYTPWIEKLSDVYHYPENIKHILTIITTALVIKYSYQRESIILNCLEETPILIQEGNDKRVQATYIRTIKKTNNELKVIKMISLHDYKGISLIQLLENLIHEFNHAINSYEKELTITKGIVFLRTGLSNTLYKETNLTTVKKEDTYILEEVINTKQTENIMNIIHALSEYEYSMTEINHTLYAIKHSFENKYQSNAYLWQTHACRTLLENRTFFSTVENLRITGNIEEIPTWFNSIHGDQFAYQQLILLLAKLTMLEQQEYKKKGLGFFRRNKQRDTFSEIEKITNTFNNNCTFK